ANGSTLPPGVQLVSGQDYTPQLWGLPSAPGTFTFTIKASDSGGNLGFKTIQLRVYSLFDTTGNLTSQPASVGILYSRQLTAGGGTAPYSWALAAGSLLPPGLSLTSGGALSGTPSAAGSYTFTLVV